MALLTIEAGYALTPISENQSSPSIGLGVFVRLIMGERAAFAGEFPRRIVQHILTAGFFQAFIGFNAGVIANLNPLPDRTATMALGGGFCGGWY